MDKSNTVKIVLAVVLFGCLMNLPYGYYQFVRYICLIGFAFLAYESKEKSRTTEMFVYISLAVLFQPFFKITLGRELWNIVDVIVGVGLIASVFIKPQNAKS